MTSAGAIEPQQASRGELRFIEATQLPQVRGTAVAAAMLHAELPYLSAALRGQLGEFIEAAVEEALTRANVPRSCPPASTFSATLAEQLTRARSAGLRGIVLALGSLCEVAGVGGVLDPEDSAALRAWVAATRQLPVAVLLDRRDLALAGYAAPQRLDVLLGWSEPPPRAHPEKTHELSDSRRLAEELHAARGPKPLGVVERLFLTRYVPLAEAEIHGEIEPFGRQVRADWAASFSRSYTEAFQALRVTGKRPAMVFDVPQIAARIARLHGARAVELLLVDGMRYDLGLRVQQRLTRAFEGKAVCADTMLLWSALPSTTPNQLDLLAHGLEALNRPMPTEEPDAFPIARERHVAVPRRLKVGQRDLVKIDVVEARMREAGPPLAERLEHVADEVSRGVLRHAETLPERTLLVVFGDHGFVVDASAGGSSPARQGGASPEEVLVPGFAWLLGGIHLERAAGSPRRGHRRRVFFRTYKARGRRWGPPARAPGRPRQPSGCRWRSRP